MLQQTQVATVRVRYEEFLERFPDVFQLAQASVDQVCEQWAGMGYYSRAKNMHAAACRIVDEYDGQLPSDTKLLRALPGVGRYTAGAVASIAHGLPVPAVDANAERVLSRLFAIDDPPGAARSNRLWSLAAQLVAQGNAATLNQALMDIGAGLCRTQSPLCAQCPLLSACTAASEGRPTAYPTRKQKAQRRQLAVAMLWITRENGDVLIEQRTASGMWAGQWQLPSEESDNADDALARLVERLGCVAEHCDVHVRHLLTHREVVAQLYRAVDYFHENGERTQWVSMPRSAPVNALSRKAIALMLA